MAETDGFVRVPHGPAPDTDDAPTRGAHRIDIAGDASGTVIAGNHNVVIGAHGSTVNLIRPQERPRPVRRERVALVPRRQREPVGREGDLEELEEALRGHGVVQLWGPPGVGKSTLLRHAARCLEPGRDGVLFLNGAHREAEDLAQEIFEACYEASGYAPTGPELRRLMAGIEVTVYIDDVDLTPERMRLLADAASDATFVFASRERSMLGESADLELRGLGRAAGLGLLERELRHPLPAAERAAAEELCTVSLGRPLLLLRAARLARLDASGAIRLPRPAAIDGLVSLLLDRLDPAATRALHLLATLGDAEVDPEHVGVLCGTPEPQTVCGRLVELGLASVTERGYRSIADVMPEVRRRFQEPVPADRLCDHFARWAVLPTTTPAQVADHGRALEMVAELALWKGRADLAVQLARAVSPFLAQSLRFGVWGRLLDQGQNAARRAGDATANAYFTHEKAIRCLLIGQRAVAAVLLAEALVLWRQLGDREGVNAALNAQQYTPPPSSAVPDTGLPDDGPGAMPGNDPGTTANPDPGTTAGPGSGADAGADPSAGFGSDPGGASGADPGNWAWHHPGAAPAADPSRAAAGHAGAPPGADFGAGQGTNPWTAPNPAADPTTHLVTHSSSAAATGGAATGGGVAATTTTALWASVIAVAVGAIVAIVIGAGVYQALTSSDRTSSASVSDSGSDPDSDSDSGSDPDSGSVPDSGSDSDVTEASPDELAGRWRDEGGDVFDISKSDDGSYQFRTEGGCGETDNVITGSSGSYSGTVTRWYQTCEVAYEEQWSIDVAADGSSADVTVTAPSIAQSECVTCGFETWTRIS